MLSKFLYFDNTNWLKIVIFCMYTYKYKFHIPPLTYFFLKQEKKIELKKKLIIK